MDSLPSNRYNVPMKIAYYITGHGLGHAVRSLKVASVLGLDHQIEIVSPINPKFIARNLKTPFSHRRVRLDVGVVQPDSLRLDLPATFAKLKELASHTEYLIRQEATWMVQQGIGRVITDIPAIPCAAARHF